MAKIIENAQARAAEIEDQALEKASRFDQVSDRRAADVFHDSRARIAQMLAQIDAVEAGIGETVRSLRTAAQQITGDLERASTEPLELSEPEPPPVEAVEQPVHEPIEPAEAPAAEGAAVEAPAPPPEPGATTPPPEPGASPPPADPGDPAVRELIRQQLTGFAESGRTRADAERMLLRFREGDQYFDLLDEIYPDETPGRRGLLRRRKARS